MAILTLADGLPLQTPHEQKDIVWLDAACTENIRIFGAAETQPRYRRLPQWLEPTLRQELVELGRKRGYKNPAFWAGQVMRGRRR